MGWGTDPVVAPAGGWGSGDAAIEPDMSAVREHFANVRGARDFGDYLAAGWQNSVTGLATRGKLPEVELDEDSPWYGRLASSIATMAGDTPAMIAGYAGGTVAGGAAGGAAGTVVPGIGNVAGATTGAIVGGFAGAGALPAGLRAALMEHYAKGDITSSNDFIERSLHVAWETAKGGVIGALTGGAGVAAKAGAPVVFGAAAPHIGAKTVIAATGAEVATLATVGKALEGKLPEPQDFLDAAVLLGGVKGSAATAGRLRTIYAATGKPPAEVLADASQNPKLLEQLKAPARDPAMIEIPEEYQPLALRETARAAIPDPRTPEALAVAERPFAEIPQAKGEPAEPTHVNYNYLNTAEEAQAALARLSEVYQERIQGQRRGTVSWDETSAEAGKMLADTLGGVDTKLVMPREPGTPAGAAEILARKQLTIGAAEDMATRAKAFMAKGADASPEETVSFLASIERASMIQAQFLGARAEAGRALNILKSTARDAERVKQIKQIVDTWGKDPQKLASMITDLDNPAAALKFAKEATKATTWEKVVEAWKAALLSGPITHAANMLGNGVFMAARAPVDAVAAALGGLRGAKPGQRVEFAEPLARITGAIHGSADGLRLAGKIMKTGDDPAMAGKVEQYRKAIEGRKGELIRLPFRALSAEDAIFRTMNERGELYTLAVRQASSEGLNPLTAEFRARVAHLVENPTEEATAASKDAAERYTFNKELGEKGQALQSFIRAWNLEWLLPFVRTPSNIIKEMARFTPMAPLVKEWRDAIRDGGVNRDKALAEVAVGTSLMTTVFVHALNGNISGAGDPDPGKRRAQSAAGWQPYSIKIGDTWYSYERLQPIGTLIGMAADLANVWDHTTEEEADKLPKMLSIAFANAVTNQTFLQGVTRFVGFLDPRSGTTSKERFLQGLAGSVIPAAVSQTANAMDPVARETDSMIDAIKSRIPGLREDLLPKRDPFGEPEPNKDRVGIVLPITKKTESTDLVRTEAARLGISIADTPKKTHVGRGTGKLGDVKLTPEQRDVFADTGGHLAHEILEPIVTSPQWAILPPLVQKRVFAKAFMQAHRYGALAALPPELRAGIAAEITAKVATELAPGQ